MSIALIVKGAETVLRLHPDGADALYGFLHRYVSGKGLVPQLVAPSDLTSLEQAAYVIAHSRGTNAALDQLREHTYPHLEGIALLDPSSDYAGFWNGLQVPKIAFISTLFGRPYAEGFDCSVHFPSGHYFTGSFSQIRQGLDAVFSGKMP
ncbi:hypothetical protein HYU19_05810 [Candidatus Woesearchaeota archaeon]|nr:hypothetical protein [Candidatus Woesearchaeota archaeon]